MNNIMLTCGHRPHAFLYPFHYIPVKFYTYVKHLKLNIKAGEEVYVRCNPKNSCKPVPPPLYTNNYIRPSYTLKEVMEYNENKS